MNIGILNLFGIGNLEFKVMLAELTTGNFLGILIFIVALLAAVTVHEAAHAWMADYLGDPTARLLGRKSLNPLKHLDPLGTLMLFLIGFGWGKPVPFDPFNLRDPRRDAALVSFAGPISNLILAAMLSGLLRLLGDLEILSNLGVALIRLNVILAVFNLLPIAPLDGFKVVGGLLPEDKARDWYGLERYGLFILLFLLFLVPNFLEWTVIPVVRTLTALLLP